MGYKIKMKMKYIYVFFLSKFPRLVNQLLLRSGKKIFFFPFFFQSLILSFEKLVEYRYNIGLCTKRVSEVNNS